MQQRAAHLSSGAAAVLTTAAVVGDPLPLHSPARELLFRDFCEALVRVGHLKFLQLPTLDRRVQALLQGHILAYAGKVGAQASCKGAPRRFMCASSQLIRLLACERETHAWSLFVLQHAESACNLGSTPDGVMQPTWSAGRRTGILPPAGV